MLLGSILAGHVADFFKLPEGGHAWAKIFLVPIVITVVAGVVFLLLFSEKRFQRESERVEAEAAATA